MKINTGEKFKFGTTLSDVEVPEALKHKFKTGIQYWDDALGGQGFTPSAVTYFAGAAGGGKTTMMLKICDALQRSGINVFYNSGEESLYQLKMTTQRLRLLGKFAVDNEIHVPTFLKKCDIIRARDPKAPFVCVIDSLQCMDDGFYPSGATNSKTPERVLSHITSYAKEHNVNPIIIGHVTKAGNFMGSNTLRHMIDTFITLKIEVKDPDLLGARILETEKNRYGGAGSRQYLMMTEDGFTLIAKE